jgi:RND family efflux transporter MFP subunit
MFGSVVNRIKNVMTTVLSTTNYIQKRYDLSYPDKNICLYFYRAAEDKLNRALLIVEKAEQDSTDYQENLRIARHYMELCNSIMGSNVMVLEHGLSLKNYQQYNIDLAKAAVTLENAKTDLLKTIIVAPFDGTVVSVGVKRNDVLSAMDYSSRSAVQLVDIKAIKFQGLVDEIDILKIKTGQIAAISIDAVPNTPFSGVVTFISPYGTKTGTSNVVKFAITIELNPSAIELKGGLSATADVAVYSAENVLLVPVSAVKATAEGSSVTLINEATGQSEKRQVTLGNQNQQFVEVLSGLKEGDKIEVEKTVTGAPVLSAPPPPPPRR